MTDVGRGIIDVDGDFSKFHRGLKGAAAEAGVQGSLTGRSFGSRFASSLESATSGIASFGKKAGVLFAGGFAFLTGSVLKLGFDRLTQIQDATASLTVVLGSAAKAGKLVNSVLKVVQGTPFSLPQFTTAARTLAAFGVDAEKIPGVLKAIGDAAAASGKGAEGVDMITDAVGKMASSGQVSLDQIWSISQSGVNALAILANGFGVTTVEMKKMISKGAVPAGKAIDILTKGIEKGSDGVAGKTAALAGTAQKLGDTVSGALGNLKTALARFGAGLLGPVFKRLPDFFDGISNSLDRLIGQVQVFELQFVAGFRGVGDSIAGKLGKAFKAIFDFFKNDPAAKFAALAGIIGGALLVAVVTLGSALVALLSPAVLLVGAFAALTAGIAYAYKRFSAFRDVVSAVGDFLSGTVLPDLRTAFEAVFGWLRDTALPAVKDFADQTIVKFKQVVDWVKANWADIQEAIGHVLVAIRDIAAVVIGAIVIWWRTFGDTILKNARKVWNSIYQVIKIALNLISGIIKTVVAVINGDWGKAWDSIRETFVRVWSGVIDILKNLLVIIGNVLTRGFELLKPIVEAGIGAIVGFFSSLPGKVATALGTLATKLIPQGLAFLGGFLVGLAQKLPFLIGFMLGLPIVLLAALSKLQGYLVPKALEFLGGFLTGLVKKLPELIGFMVTLPGKLVAKLADLGAKLIPKGISLLAGFATGMAKKLPDLLSFVSGLPARLLGAIGDLGSALFDAGKALIQGLIRGIKAINPASIIKNIAGGIVSGFKSALHIGSPSKVMADEVGRPMAQGIWQGFKKGNKNPPSVPIPSIGGLAGRITGSAVPAGVFPVGQVAGQTVHIDRVELHDGVDTDRFLFDLGFKLAS